MNEFQTKAAHNQREEHLANFSQSHAELEGIYWITDSIFHPVYA